jgi:hypothetical protein
MATTNINQKKNFGMFSRLRFYNLVKDENSNRIRIGKKDESFIRSVKNLVDYEEFKITPQVEYRPDLISSMFYGTPHLWWVIQEYNNFVRMPQDFYVDRVIKIPDSDQLTSLLI